MARYMKDIARLREAARLCRREAERTAIPQKVSEYLALAQEIELRLGSLMAAELAVREHAEPSVPATPLRAA